LQVLLRVIVSEFQVVNKETVASAQPLHEPVEAGTCDVFYLEQGCKFEVWEVLESITAEKLP
jgi:hypothetical protein